MFYEQLLLLARLPAGDYNTYRCLGFTCAIHFRGVA